MPLKLKMTSCQSATDMIAVHGIDKAIFTVFRKYEIDEAALKAFRADKSGAIVGEKIAARYGWKAGQPIVLKELENISFTIKGIFTTNGSADDSLILVGREFLQDVADERGISNRVMVKLNPGVDSISVCEEINALPWTINTTTQPEKDFLATALAQLSDLVSISKVVIGVVIAVILIAMGNAISMATRERSREFAVLRTLGFQRRAIMLLVTGEGFLHALIGGLLGCGIVQAVISAGVLTDVSSCSVTITLVAGTYAWVFSLISICAASTLGSILPAWQASRLKIVDAIRRED